MSVIDAIAKHNERQNAARIGAEIEIYWVKGSQTASWKQSSSSGTFGLNTRRLTENQRILMDNIQAIGTENFGDYCAGEAQMSQVPAAAAPKALTFRNQKRMLKTVQKIQRGEQVAFQQEFEGYEASRAGSDCSLQWNQKIILANLCMLSEGAGAATDHSDNCCNYKLKQIGKKLLKKRYFQIEEKKTFLHM